ncbi:uncharacterized protein Bfra_010633 [Botrytis fragariae]|uniref:Uncharacterized protein n=1 Tax=Botrytis fragariae TaxID=1964551 RepID=A0A8H6AI54_9HELO|nr:uncharacterized protein Bfra_010633 [Botrytis fragariae]KAF5867658.1 hypothetical protein Bfra_010633 [Botrytis fragariae]
MPRMLDLPVYYTDVQWRALKSKARNNHPSISPRNAEIIMETTRVYDAILKDEDPTPLPQFADSITYNKRQVNKFVLYDRHAKHGHITVMSPCYLPKRRPEARVGKAPKQVGTIIKPTRDPRGSTFGFIRGPEVAVIEEEKEAEELTVGEDKAIGGKKVSTKKSGPAGKKTLAEKKRSSRLKSKLGASDDFVRRSSRRIGGAVAASADIDIVAGTPEAEIVTREMRKLADYNSPGSREGSSEGDELASNLNFINGPPIPYKSPYSHPKLVYQSPYAPIPDAYENVASREANISAPRTITPDAEDNFSSRQTSTSTPRVVIPYAAKNFPSRDTTVSYPHVVIPDASDQFSSRQTTISAPRSVISDAEDNLASGDTTISYISQ